MTKNDKQALREKLYSLLGDLPSRSHEISARTVSVEERENYILEKLLLDLNGIEMVPAYFVKPRKLEGRVPVILYNHAHGGVYELGKEELLAGRAALQKPPYADLLTQMGYCALCIDTWAFGERRGMREFETYMQMLWSGQVMWGMMVYDSLRAVDYLVSRPETDTDRIGTLGISMGSTMGWWLAALDTRIKVCVDICCLTDFQALLDTRGLERHGIYYYVPGLLKYFTAAQINALIAPRPHLGLAGNYDQLTPPQGLDRIDFELKKAYDDEGAADAWRLIRYNCGHMETAAMRQDIIDFLKKWL